MFDALCRSTPMITPSPSMLLPFFVSSVVGATRDGQCLFRTGDKPLFSHNGSFEVIGRMPIQSHDPEGPHSRSTERTIQGTPDQSLAKTPVPPQVLTRGREWSAIVDLWGLAIPGVRELRSGQFSISVPPQGCGLRHRARCDDVSGHRGPSSLASQRRTGWSGQWEPADWRS